MNQRIFTRMSATPVIITMFLLILASVTIMVTSAEVTELNVNPEVVGQGGTLSISGKAPPNEKVELNSSFAISLPVSEDGKYSRDFIGIHFPVGEKIFSVTAENIKNIWISSETVEVFKNATNGIATISVPFPIQAQFGPIDISVYGDVADNANSVNLNVATSIKVIADLNGDFTLDINTGGVPLGEFLITARGEDGETIEKTVRIDPPSTPTPTPSSDGGDGDGAPDTTPTPTLTPSPSPTPTPTPTSAPTLIPAITSTPSPTVTPQTTPIKNETEEKSTSPTPQNETKQPPQETTKPFRIPGFESIGCITALVIVIMLKRGKK